MRWSRRMRSVRTVGTTEAARFVRLMSR